MPLCTRCEKRSARHERRYGLRQLRDTTCEFCHIMYRGLVSVLSSTGADETSDVIFPPFSPRNDSHFEVRVIFHRAIASFWCSWGTTCPWGLLPTHRDITPIDYEGDGSFQTALQWIDDCTAHHRCGSPALPATLPTRVVDTGLFGGAIRLVDGASKTGRYVCLSHCWGQEPPLMTTSQTLQSHMNEIGWDSIPATFQDAIRIARRLGVQYIWIDSLCIIQDSVQDWENESSRMADIYRNSYVTIAGASSKDNRGGLDLNKPRQTGATLKGTTSSGKPYSIRVQCSIRPHSYIDDTRIPKDGIRHPIVLTTSIRDDFGKVFGVFPLLTRGWVFQERLLSPRFLQFGKDELLWDCKESMVCECGQRRPDLPYNQVAIRDKDGKLASHKWRKIIEFYSSLNLTYPQDKLPALSGLAKQMQEQKPSVTYLAGLWSDSLDLDLLWIPYGPDDQRNDEYIAPSWSWAQVGRRIIYPSVWRADEEQPAVKTLDVYFELVQAVCTASYTNPTAKVSEGVLELRSPLSAISVHKSPDPAYAAEFRYSDTPFFLCADRDVDLIRNNWRLPFADQRRRVFLDHPDAYRRFLDKTNLYSCRVTRVEVSELSLDCLELDAHEVIQVEFSLLLERVDRDGNLFRRVGLLADGRVISGHRGDADSWNKDPSCFESSTDRNTVTII
ncbi:HET-domain-containing protein [Nemania abortiva]|nr:HET-domain-containing protein [Nemania abortiva]